MFKKALKVVTTFGVLLACYAGYVRVFAIIAAGIGPVVRPPEFRPRKETATQLEAVRTAAEALGPGHWSADKALPIRYYNHERGYWMYAKEVERRNEGKQLVFQPFAIVWKSRDGRALKVATSDRAIVDLDQPVLSISNKQSNNAPMKVVHAQLEGNVQLRDDKGTRRSTIDDLVIGPIPYVEFDEPSLQIRSRSDIVIKDRDMRITGYDLLIQLRPKGDGAPGTVAGGFDAKSASLEKNVHIVLNDVGNSGILPGTAGGSAKPNNKGEGKGTGPEDERTPLDLRCAGKMRVELPPSRRPVLVGPPAPGLPTMLYFNRDVVVRRGKPGQAPDQLDCDDLRLTMVPKPKGAPKPKPQVTVETELEIETAALDGADEPVPAATGAGTELTLREAKATGHAVWLQSKGQGITARCNELIHRKLAPDRADETYLRGDSKTKLWVEKIETASAGPDKGQPKSVTTIRTIDATIFDDGQGSENSTIVARGPGLLETRPSRDKPVERKAIWQDHLVMRTDFDVNNVPSKQVTLTGKPELIDLAKADAQTSLLADKKIEAWLTPKTKPASNSSPAPAGAGGQKQGGADTFQIQRLQAQGNVQLISPGKNMNARDTLDAMFQPDEPPAGATRNGEGTKPAAPAAAPAPAPTSAPTAPAGTEPAKADGAAPAREKPADPAVTVTADRVWALIRLKEAGAGPQTKDATVDSSGISGGQMQEVRLRGGVVFHQDPAPGKSQGTDVTGQALDVVNRGDGKMKFVVLHHATPEKATAAELALTPNARVATEEMTITGPHIGLDQGNDHAWVNGPGTLTQLAPRGLLTDKGLAGGASRDADKPRQAGQRQGQEPTEDANKRPLTISWKSRMSFLGRPDRQNAEGPAVAVAQFHHGVRAVMEDAQLSCQERLDVYMDRPVSLARPKGSSKELAAGEEPEPRPQIALIDCFADVVIESRKTAPDSRRLLVQKQRIEGARVTYDKVTGNFHVPGQGKVSLWNRDDGSESPLAVPAMPGVGAGAGAVGAGARTETGTGRRIRLTANPGATPPARRATAVVGSNGSQVPPGRVGADAAAAGRSKVPTPPLKLTVITFDREMIGRFVAGQDKDVTETRWARFLGDVQALHATVSNENVPVDFDRPPDDYMLLTAQKLDVSSVPTPGKGATKNYLMAVSEAQARSRKETIRADVIKYDSQKGLFQAYSEENRPVIVIRQDSAGQPPSTVRGQGVKYNRLTGESDLINPMSTIEFVQANTGIRPGPAPDTKDKKIKTPRNGPALRIPTPSNTERKGMTGK